MTQSENDAKLLGWLGTISRYILRLAKVETSWETSLPIHQLLFHPKNMRNDVQDWEIYVASNIPIVTNSDNGPHNFIQHSEKNIRLSMDYDEGLHRAIKEAHTVGC